MEKQRKEEEHGFVEGASNSSLEAFMNVLREKDRNEAEFHETVYEVFESVWPLVQKKEKYRQHKIPERITEPERVMQFRVTWVDDEGEVQVNRGYQVGFNSAIGPYKGGLRFHPSVNLDLIKALAFEQTFKNCLTGMPMGGGKGGADFDVKGKSDSEIMRFCQSFMDELHRYIGHNSMIPAGDIGVGKQEIGYLFGQYKRLENKFTGAITGKGIDWGGSELREEATGYGLIYYLCEMFDAEGQKIEGKSVAISGSGNVAQFAAEKAMQLGAEVISLSDSDGVIYDPEGLNESKLNYVKHLKNKEKGRISEYAEHYCVKYIENGKPWRFPCDIALPCATQNEINADDAKKLVTNGCRCVVEGANKPTKRDAVKIFLNNDLLFGPGKAANAGGVAVSGVEMSQNKMCTHWSRSKVDKKIKNIMKKIHEACVHYGKEDNSTINYVNGANIAGFTKVANAMVQQGVV